MIEQTLSIAKPDAVERNLENRIKSFFKEKNLKILKNKKVHITKEEAAEFYKEHQTKFLKQVNMLMKKYGDYLFIKIMIN